MKKEIKIKKRYLKISIYLTGIIISLVSVLRGLYWQETIKYYNNSYWGHEMTWWVIFPIEYSVIFYFGLSILILIGLFVYLGKFAHSNYKIVLV